MRVMFVFWLASVLLWAVCPCPYINKDVPQTRSLQKKLDPLGEMNLKLQEFYGINKASMLDEIMTAGSPVITMNPLTLHLPNGTVLKSTVQNFTPLADVLKECSHTSLLAVVALADTLANADATPDKNFPVTLSNLEQIEWYLTHSPSFTRELLTLKGLDSAQIDRNMALFTEVNAFLSKVLQDGEVSLNQLSVFATSLMKPYINPNIYDGGKSTIDSWHEQVMVWKEVLTQEEWDQMMVILSATHMANEGLLYEQYFSRLLGTPMGLGERVITSQTDETFALLATHRIDFLVGQAFFEKPIRMHRDLLMDFGHQYIPVLLEGYPDPNPNTAPDTSLPLLVVVAITLVSSGLTALVCLCMRESHANTQRQNVALLHAHNSTPQLGVVNSDS